MASVKVGGVHVWYGCDQTFYTHKLWANEGGKISLKKLSFIFFLGPILCKIPSTNVSLKALALALVCLACSQTPKKWEKSIVSFFACYTLSNICDETLLMSQMAQYLSQVSDNILSFCTPLDCFIFVFF